MNFIFFYKNKMNKISQIFIQRNLKFSLSEIFTSRFVQLRFKSFNKNLN